MVLTNCTLKLKNVCGIDGNAITNVLYNKLCLLICTYLGPTKKECFVLYFKFYLATSILLQK